MNIFLRAYVVAFLFTIFLAGCGGGGTVVPQPEPIVQKVPDVTFINIATNPALFSVMPGERDVEVVAFMPAWKDKTPRSIGQLVFKNQYTGSISGTFKKFWLIDGGGKDINTEANYFIRVDDDKQSVIVDFVSMPWTPYDSMNMPPKRYSLMASMDPLAKEDQKFSFTLADVQMHDAGVDVVSQVAGLPFKVTKVSGIDLPSITTNSQYSLMVDRKLFDTVMEVGSFTVTCPANKVYACIFTGIDYSSYGMTTPYLTVDGMVLSQVEIKSPGFYHASFYYYIPQGTSKTFSLNATVFDVPPQPGFGLVMEQWVYISVDDLSFSVGAINVSPIVPTGRSACGLLVRDSKNCLG